MKAISISVFSIITALLPTALGAQGQDDWTAPQTAAATINPIVASEDSISRGQASFEKACASCHGTMGAGDGFASAMLKRKPGDLGQGFGAQSDGELFWKIRTGNQVMPSSSDSLSEEDTWHVINFVRTLGPQDAAAHPWASFPEGAWVDVHTDHVMVMGQGAEPTSWASDSRMEVGSISADAVTVLHANPDRKISEQASVAIPAVGALPGVRALGQWPHDIFPFGPEREAGLTAEEKLPTPTDVKTEMLGNEEVVVNGTAQMAKIVRREWKENRGDQVQQHVMSAWIVEGIELPAKWTLKVDGKMLSESELISLSEPVVVGERSIACLVTLTRKHLKEGVIVKRRWSSAQVPGFLVKMESQMDTDDFSLTVNEWVTDFRSSPTASAGNEQVRENPPGSRPALGFMPDYQGSNDGVLVDDVTPGGPADEGGIVAGDLIIEIDGKEVFGLEDYMEVMSVILIGEEVVVKVERGEQDLALKVVVGER